MDARDKRLFEQVARRAANGATRDFGRQLRGFASEPPVDFADDGLIEVPDPNEEQRLREGRDC